MQITQECKNKLYFFFLPLTVNRPKLYHYLYTSDNLQMPLLPPKNIVASSPVPPEICKIQKWTNINATRKVETDTNCRKARDALDYTYDYDMFTPLSFMEQISPSSNPPLAPFPSPILHFLYLVLSLSLPFLFPSPPFRLSLPLFQISASVSCPRGVWSEPQSKLNLVHFKLKIWHIGRIIFVTFMKNFNDFPPVSCKTLPPIFSGAFAPTFIAYSVEAL